jgi:hypothetical protein
VLDPLPGHRLVNQPCETPIGDPVGGCPLWDPNEGPPKGDWRCGSKLRGQPIGNPRGGTLLTDHIGGPPLRERLRGTTFLERLWAPIGDLHSLTYWGTPLWVPLLGPICGTPFADHSFRPHLADPQLGPHLATPSWEPPLGTQLGGPAM